MVKKQLTFKFLTLVFLMSIFFPKSAWATDVEFGYTNDNEYLNNQIQEKKVITDFAVSIYENDEKESEPWNEKFNMISEKINPILLRFSK